MAATPSLITAKLTDPDTAPMHDLLLGYLMSALEPAEADRVERLLEQEPALRQELELMDRALAPLRAGRELLDTPAGLNARTCQLVFDHADGRQGLLSAAVMAAIAAADMPAAANVVDRATNQTGAVSGAASFIEPTPSVVRKDSWSVADIVVAAGIFLAASMLLFPSIQLSQHNARLTNCRNNLRELGLALTNYSQKHNGFFPGIDQQGPLSTAGSYAARLLHGGFLEKEGLLVCPESQVASQSEQMRIPSIEELQQFKGDRLTQLQKALGGSYGYNLGFVSNGNVYHPTRNLGRPNFAMMSDEPGAAANQPLSSNHGGYGQNVLFEDGSVRYLTSNKPGGSSDDIFHNARGMVSAGIGPNDAVIGSSSARPLE